VSETTSKLRKREQRIRSRENSWLMVRVYRFCAWFEHRILFHFTGVLSIWGFTSICGSCGSRLNYGRVPIFGVVKPYNDGYLGGEVVLLSGRTIWCPFCDRCTSTIGVTNYPIDVSDEFKIMKEAK